MQGTIDIQEPYDWHFGHDFFTNEGKETLTRLMDDPLLAAEHWAPECKLFSRARGRPIHLSDGRVIEGPKPVRDEHHLMGFPWVSTHMKMRLRQSNAMALKGLKRLEAAPQLRLYESIEHPLRSWMWMFTLARNLVDMGYREDVGSHCCFGGRREKWFQFLNNIPGMDQFIARECPGHTETLQRRRNIHGSCAASMPEDCEHSWTVMGILPKSIITRGRPGMPMSCARAQHG